MERVRANSRVKVQKEPGKNKVKRIGFDGFAGDVRMGVHNGIADFFGIKPDEPLPSTLDYVVAAVAGCLAGTVAGAMEARGISGGPENLETTATGKIEEIDGKLLLTNIAVHYKLKIPKDKRPNMEKALEHHDDRCPVSASIRRGITIEWHADIVEE
jgi:uncharacterized OsmC-like protein